MLTAPEISSHSGSSNMQTSDRRCENPDCNVSKLISMVPKRKITQFVSDPVVIEKPMLVNGFTAVFQVDGSSARLLDIKNPNGDPQTKPIYRIIPNSHVHVVNYVVVDTDETYLKKINENDPVTMQKLLTSQKESADQMLKKIMSGQGSSATAAMTTVVSTINNNNNVTTQPVPIPQSNVNNPTTAAATMATTNATQKNTIKLPVRMHPNLKITAVASGEAVNTPSLATNVVASKSTAVAAPAPYIQPVPLTNLQSPTSALHTNVPSAPSTSSNLGTVDKPTYDKMQAEINDLRRTVAMLAEAQAKNQKNQQQQSTNSKSASKRARISLPKCV
ncbi:buddy of Hmr 2 [Cochliomyia hominivorax]